MINLDTQVRLSIKLQGRLGATASNSSTRKQIRKVVKAARYGHIIKVRYNEPEVQEATQSLLIGSGAPAWYTTEEARPPRIKSNEWKKKRPIERLETHLQIIANDIAHSDNAVFSYELLN